MRCDSTVAFEGGPQCHHRHVVESRAQASHVFPRDIGGPRDEAGPGKYRDLLAVDRAPRDLQEITLQPVRVDDVIVRTTRFTPHAMS